jgi:cytochrome c peroxidase
MKSIFNLFFYGFAIGFLFISCSNSEDQYQEIPVSFVKPSNFPDVMYNLDGYPLTEAGIALGKELFYEGRLSSDGIISCGFCHIQKDAFTHHGHTFSHGVGESIGTRNAPPVQNMAFQNNFMWDGATDDLNALSLIPISSPIEMNGSLNSIVQMLNSDAKYRKMFERAFPNKPIDTEHLLKALGQFMVTMVSSNSKFDKFKRNESGGTLTTEEFEGYELFNQKCASCHATDLFTDNSFRNNGLQPNPAINDKGRYNVTNSETDKYKFKVPSLRNIAKTKPYMHDGRLFTLEAVLDHYDNQVVDMPTLDPLLRQGTATGIPLTEQEKSKIIAFLKTLTDEDFLNNPKFSEQ